MRDHIECESKPVTKNVFEEFYIISMKVLSRSGKVDCRRGLDWIIGFIVLIHSRVVTTMLPPLTSTIHSNRQASEPVFEDFYSRRESNFDSPVV